MGSIVTDATALPLLVVRVRGTVDDAAFERYLDESLVRIRSGERYAMVLDTIGGGVAPSSQRRRQADFIRDHSDALARNCLGAAFVIDNPLVRGALTAIMWLQPMPYPHTVVGSVEAGTTWCRQRLAAAGL